MRVGTITICIMAVLTAPGCASLFGKFTCVDSCEPGHVDSATALDKAPAWVPGSPMRATKPTTGCVAGDGAHYLDRLCVVADVRGMPSVDQSAVTARQKSLRLLGEALTRNITAVLGSAASEDQVERLGEQLSRMVGRVTDTWRSPDCTTYAIAEVKLVDITYVVEGPDLSSSARALLLEHAADIITHP